MKSLLAGLAFTAAHAGWVTIFNCRGDQMTVQRITQEDWKMMTPDATRVRVCTAGKYSECVTSKKNSTPIKNLQAGVANLQQKDKTCDLACIKNSWEGPEDLLKRLTWTCQPAAGAMFYHACGNHAGLHISSGRGHCEWDWQETDSLEIQIETDEELPKESPTAPPVTAPTRAGEWFTIFSCMGDGETIDRVLNDDWQNLAYFSWGVRICSRAMYDDCVYSKGSNYALKNLQMGLFNLQPRGVTSCNGDCIEKMWDGPEERLAHMTWTCDPNEQNLLYHACGNHGGLHITGGMKGHCEWDWEESHALEIQLLSSKNYVAPTPKPTVEPERLDDKNGKWETIFNCLDDGLDDDRVTLENWKELAQKATSVRICSMDGSDCVTSRTDYTPAMNNLVRGELHLQPNTPKCDLSCIKEQWYGPDLLLETLVWTCNPNEKGMVFHACGNSEGLHMGLNSKACTWDWEETGEMKIDIFIPSEKKDDDGGDPNKPIDDTPGSEPTDNPNDFDGDFSAYRKWCGKQESDWCTGCGGKWKNDKCNPPKDPKKLKCKKLSPEFCIPAECSKPVMKNGKVKKCGGTSKLKLD